LTVKMHTARIISGFFRGILSPFRMLSQNPC
jgi:hypothetical protein